MPLLYLKFNSPEMRNSVWMKKFDPILTFFATNFLTKFENFGYSENRKQKYEFSYIM